MDLGTRTSKRGYCEAPKGGQAGSDFLLHALKFLRLAVIPSSSFLQWPPL